ncbi:MULTISPECIES: helix-turn-helix domain-containing protein [Vibrio]|uniref:helix-turn-helix domain-containing protein n=1 Tax=Vibrio TaxID=662 RepID=UPI000C825F5D|nr:MULTISPECIES: AraC family transcriptional regulator [Vibrio]PMG70833.1 cupin [Vibrio lentus]PMH91018.1 cupin [Vibrio lentus]PMI08343.1 cupin [Vibrio lentus]PMI97417.1 cupin [Vibrio lentus]PMJ16829.1 cupin [Vibrio lentus]
MDLLSQLMEHFSIRTGVFYSGNLCGVSSFKPQQGKEGHLHVLSAGELTLSSAHTEYRQLSQPCIIYLPNSTPHVIEGVGEGAEVVCANVEYRSGQMNPLLSALPDVIVIPFADAPNLMPVIEVLFRESGQASSGQQSSGQQYLMDKLSDALMALIFRHLIEQQQIDQGVFSALAHPRLAPVVTAINLMPARHFSIEQMASLAAMSRTQFIEAFKREVGETPGDYVQKWRVSVAQSLLLQNKPINWVADEVGYNSYSGFSRAFQHVTGMSPRLWLKQNVS